MSPMLSSHEGGGSWPGGLNGPLAGLGRKKYLFGDGSYSGNIMQAASVNNGPYYAARHYELATGSLAIETSITIPAGAVVTGLLLFEGAAFSNRELFLMRRNAAGNFTCVKKLVVATTASYTYQQFDLPAPYTIPNDGCTYHIGARFPDDALLCNNKTTLAWAYKAGTTTEGATDTYTEAQSTNYGTLCVGWVGKEVIQPQASYTLPILLDRTSGANIGDMTGGGGLASLFDGITSQAYTSAAWADTATAWGGKDYTAIGGKAVAQARAYATSNYGYYNNTGAATTAYLEWADVPTGPWTVAASATGTDSNNTSILVTNPSPAPKNCWRMRIVAPSSACKCAEIQFFESATLQNCIVITGAATVAPDATTGASVFTAQNVVVDGASASLSPSTNSKGLIGIVSGSVRLVNGGRIHIDKLGKAGNFGNLTVLDLVPDTLKRKLKSSLAEYMVLGEGAAGAAGKSNSNGYGTTGGTGTAAGAMQTGGGGSGAALYTTNGGPVTSGNGGKGGPCCGGAASGVGYYQYPSADAGPYGGPPSASGPIRYSYTPPAGVDIGGAAGDPPGAGTLTGSAAPGAGGGLLMLFTPLLTIAAGCVVSADGSSGGNATDSYPVPGSGAGGGCVVIGTLSGGYQNSGTVRANGGASGTKSNDSYTGTYGGPGGAGSVNTFTVS